MSVRTSISIEQYDGGFVLHVSKRGESDQFVNDLTSTVFTNTGKLLKAVKAVISEPGEVVDKTAESE